MSRKLAGGLPYNQFVAAVAATYVEKLLAGSCTWMASYFDLADGVFAHPTLAESLNNLFSQITG